MGSHDVTYPASDGAVDDGCPNEGEDHGGEHTTTLGYRAHEDTNGNSRELELIERVQQFRDEWGTGTRLVQDVSQSIDKKENLKMTRGQTT